MRKQPIAKWDQLGDRAPFHAVVGNTDLVVIRYDENVSVLYGRCQHRGALMSDGCIKGSNIICGLHNWDFRIDTGVSEYNDKERLHKFEAWREDGEVFVDADEIAAWESEHPQPYNRQAYQGAFADLSGTPEEPYTRYIQALARDGLTKTGPVAVALRQIAPRSAPRHARVRLGPQARAQAGDDKVRHLPRPTHRRRPGAHAEKLGSNRGAYGRPVRHDQSHSRVRGVVYGRVPHRHYAGDSTIP